MESDIASEIVSYQLHGDALIESRLCAIVGITPGKRPGVY
jgi:hypothetical protein